MRSHVSRQRPRPVTSVALALIATSAALLAFTSARSMSRTDEPELIGSGVVSTRDYERDAALSPDGRTLYFTKRTIWRYFSVICVSRLVDGQWNEPEIASFSGRYPDATPAFSPDGNTLYFASRRPADSASTLRRDYDLWAVDRKENEWSELRHLPAPINSAAEEGSPSLTTDGRLLFTSERGGFTEHGPRKRSAGDFEKALHAPGNGLGDLYSIGAAALGIRP